MSVSDQRHIFVTFAIQDAKYRDLLVAKARRERRNCMFAEMAIKAPADGLWQNHCRRKISASDGVIALISENTAGATGVLWELKCARELELPILAVRVDFETVAPERATGIEGLTTVPWKWEIIATFLETTALRRESPTVRDHNVERATRLAG